MQKKRGFSLLEILITITIVAILAAISVPSFENIFEHSNQKILSQQLLRAINFARSQAIALGQTVTLCKSNDQATCGGDWGSGYIILANDQVLYSFSNNKFRSQLNWRAFPIYLDHLEYLSSGLPNFQNGTFWSCPKDSGNPSWAIMMNQSGRVRVVYPDASGEIIDDEGEKLACATMK